ncbi:MAG: caspase family protein [Armatimonadetes bacterium]|nr:caspase family protein [Armatimonadota bacterium]
MRRIATWLALSAVMLGVPGPAAEKREPRLHVVSVGVARYKLRALNLRFADDDARSFADALTAQAPPDYSRLTRTVVINRYATVSNLERLLRRLGEEAGPDDTVALFFSGHGTLDAKGHFYFATHEADPEDVGHTALRWEDVGKAVRLLQAKNLFVFLDACNAGGTRGIPGASASKLAASLSKRSRMMIFCSSRGDESSIELQKARHGAFTEAVLEALEGGADEAHGDVAKDGVITVEELRDFVPTRVSQLSKGLQNPGKPAYGGCEPKAPFALVPHD